MTAHAFFAAHGRVRTALSFFLTFLLLLPSLTVLAHPLPQTAKQVKPAVSAPSPPASRSKDVSQLKLGDVISARNNVTGKVEWKQVIHASKRTVPSLLSIRLIDTQTGEPAETLVCPLDEPVKLTGGKGIPAGHLCVGNSIVSRAGPICKVKAMFLLRKPGGFLLYDVRIGALSPAQIKRLASEQKEQVQSKPRFNVNFAAYHYADPALAYAGYVAAASSGGTVNPYLFQGQQYDPASGDYYLRARYYDPTMGRFLSQDPFAGNEADPPSLHRYLYASNDPVNRTDPTGLEEIASLEAGSEVNAELAPTENEGALAGAGTLSELNSTFGAAYGYAGTATPLAFTGFGGAALRGAALFLAGGFFASTIGSDFAGVPSATQQVYEGGDSTVF